MSTIFCFIDFISYCSFNLRNILFPLLLQSIHLLDLHSKFFPLNPKREDTARSRRKVVWEKFKIDFWPDLEASSGVGFRFSLEIGYSPEITIHEVEILIVCSLFTLVFHVIILLNCTIKLIVRFSCTFFKIVFVGFLERS